MDPTIILSIVLAFIGVGVSVAVWLGSTQVSKIQKHEETPTAYLRQVDAEAYERAKKIYESAIDQLEEEVARLQRGMIEQQHVWEKRQREFRGEILRLNREIIRMHRRLTEGGVDPGTDSSLPVITEDLPGETSA